MPENNFHNMEQAVVTQTREETTTLSVECEIELEKVKIESLSELLSELKEKLNISDEIADVLKDIIGPNEDLFDEVIKITDFKEIPLTFQPIMKDFALTLDFLVPRAYRYITSEYKSFLPQPNAFAAWYKNSEADPGFSQECLDTITELVKCESDQCRTVICQLAFVEKEIFPQIQKIGDKAYGYSTVSTIDKPSNDIADRVLMFMVVDINGAWKMPVGYFPVKTLNCNMRQNLIEKAIINVEETGARVLGVTFNGEHINFSTMKSLGASFGMDEPVFTIKVAGNPPDRAYYVYPDPLDMIRRVRLSFILEGYFLDGDGNIVDYSYVKELQKVYDSSLTNPELKQLQNYFQRKKVNVNLVEQLLNKSIADALDYCRANANVLNLPQFAGCEATGKFIRMMSNVFEVLKSHQQSNPEVKSSVLIGNLKRIKQFCENAQKYLFDLCLLSNVQTTSNGNEIRYTFSEKETVISSAHRNGFLGLLVCLENLPKIFETAQGELKDQSLKTNFLNQDSMEQFYYSIKTNLRSNCSPSILQFRDAYKKLVTGAQVIRDNTGTCIVGTESVKMLYVNPARCLQVINNISHGSVFQNIGFRFKDEIEYEEVVSRNFRTDEEVLSEKDFIKISAKLSEIENLTAARNNSSYVASCASGYIVSVLLKKAHCKDCTALLVDSSDESNSRQTYDLDDKPSKFVLDISELTEEILNGEIQYLGINFIYENRHETEMISQVTKHFDFESDHFMLNKAHKYSMIELVSGLYLKVRIYHELNKDAVQDSMKNVYRALVHFDDIN